MSDQHRPGGLTALAVVNFIFGALGLLGTLVPMLPSLVQDLPNGIEALPTLSRGALLLMAASSGIGGVLFILSGIGYLRQKRFLGRVVGNVCAVFAVITTIATIVWTPAQLGGGLNLVTLLNIAYPLLTLALLNLTFKDDLTR